MARTIQRPVPALRTPVNYDLIIGADLHIREDTPNCRTDDYLNAQFAKMYFIRQLCCEHDCPFLVAGDVFDHWKPSPFLLSRCLELLPHKIICVAGQHDLPQHNLQELAKTGLNTLQQAGRVIMLAGGGSLVVARSSVVFGWSYGEKAGKPDLEADKHILLWHRLTCFKAQPWPGAQADTVHAMLKDHPEYDLIVTGDNHQQFAVKDSHSFWLVNPGSMMRMSADQADFEPAVYGWVEKDHSITRIPLPINKEVVSRDHLPTEKKESRDKRMEAYITRAKQQYEDRLSFEKNLENHFKTNKERDGVEQITWKAVGK